MGLMSGDYGPKKALLARSGGDLASLVPCAGVADLCRRRQLDPDAVVALVDGNVAARRRPKDARDVAAALDCFCSVVFASARAAGVTVVVFDDGPTVTAAKRHEQASRDKAHKKVLCSSDRATAPTSDDYGLEELYAIAEVEDLFTGEGRRAQPRYFDYLAAEAVARFQQSYPDRLLIFLSIDPRGADRPIGARREPGVLASRPIAELERRLAFCVGGEGDLQLARAERAVRSLAADEHPLFAGLLAIVTCTIDTDAFPIMLLDRATRVAEGTDDAKIASFFLPPDQRKPLPGEDEPPSHLAWDIGNLACDVFSACWPWKDRPPTGDEQRALFSLVAASWALQKSDFVQTSVPGVRANHTFQAVHSLLLTDSDAVKKTAVVWSGNPQRVLEFPTVLRRLIFCHAQLLGAEQVTKSGAPNAFATKTIYRMHDPQPDTLKQTAFTIAYWTTLPRADDALETSLAEFGINPEPAIVFAA